MSGKKIDRGTTSKKYEKYNSMMGRYQQPRPSQREADVYTLKTIKKDEDKTYKYRNIAAEQFKTEIREAIEKGHIDRKFPGTNISPTPKQKLRRILREKIGTKT
tara:strand:- start:235 stop:546 length:312 start_codon:yes stop_codon:yes gene_type:complete